MTKQTKIILCVVAVLAALGSFFIYGARAFGFFFLLLCPLLHIFMMGGHGHGGSCHNNKDDKQNDQNKHHS